MLAWQSCMSTVWETTHCQRPQPLHPHQLGTMFPTHLTGRYLAEMLLESHQLNVDLLTGVPHKYFGNKMCR